jgi:hypothetical protein
LCEHAPRPWQLAFLSNTGVMESVVGPGMTSPEDGLMRPDGTAGQWVVEVCGTNPQLVSRETASGIQTGHQYEYKRMVVTRHGVSVSDDSPTTCAFAVPLEQCPLSPDIMAAYESARTLAVRFAKLDFRLMSVALNRPSGGTEWRFRFYNSQDLLLVVRVSGDGSRVIA